MSEPALRILNLGAGVQSSTLALMIKHGEVENPPSHAIFADTGWEPPSVYQWLSWLEGAGLPFPVHRVRAMPPRSIHSNLKLDIEASVAARALTTTSRFAGMPLFTESNGRTHFGHGQLKRQCTADYKIEPIEKFIRSRLLKVKRVGKGVMVEQLFGISADEIFRVKESPVPWLRRRWPLVFERRMTRQDCLRWMESHGYPRPPRSACIGCPYHSNAEWKQMRDERPADWQQAVEFDEAIRNGVRGTREKCFLHSSLRPLAEADLRSEEDRGQLSLFTAECEGHCAT